MPDPVFLLSIVTIFSGIIGLCIRYAFRSKCSHIKCCFGLCQIERDIRLEIELEQKQIAERSSSQSPRAETSNLEAISPRSRVDFTEV